MITALEIDERRGCTSASNAAADALCAGRFLAQKGLPRVETEDSRAGTVVHDALATGRFDTLDIEQRQTAERCLEIERKKLTEFFGDDAPKADCFRESPAEPERSRMWIQIAGQNGTKIEHSCRPDVIYRFQDRALIFEYKTLFGEVAESPRNLQLRDQQCIVRGNLKIAGDIGVCVIQPWIQADPQICVYTAEDSKRAEAEMFARVFTSHDPASPRTPGEVQCKFCLAKGRCKEYQQWSSSLTPAMLTVLEVPIADWTPQQRSNAAAALLPAKQLIDFIEEGIKAALEKDPQSCPGWYLKPGNVVESIKDPQGVFERFAKLGGKLEQFMECIKVTKTPLKNALSQVTGAKGKKLETAMAVLTEGLTEAKRNSPSLKRAGEK